MSDDKLTSTLCLMFCWTFKCLVRNQIKPDKLNFQTITLGLRYVFQTYLCFCNSFTESVSYVKNEGKSLSSKLVKGSMIKKIENLESGVFQQFFNDSKQSIKKTEIKQNFEKSKDFLHQKSKQINLKKQ